MMCDRCLRGKQEMCDYFRENYLEAEDIKDIRCPEFREDPEAAETEIR